VDAVLLSTLVSFGVIFVAELGDKSQLMALTFATRFSIRPVLIGITIATAIVHLASVAIGYGLGAALPTGWINLVAALAFIVFGFWTLRGDTLTEDEQDKVNRVGKRAVIAVGTAFFLAELGDKTMLATITLATDYGWLGTWIGSTLGMVAADALAIVVGMALGKRLPEKVIAYGAAALSRRQAARTPSSGSAPAGVARTRRPRASPRTDGASAASHTSTSDAPARRAGQPGVPATARATR
jgi:putative Ca2+/H+ antiporter (TMEM165/GDT1 family)